LSPRSYCSEEAKRSPRLKPRWRGFFRVLRMAGGGKRWINPLRDNVCIKPGAITREPGHKRGASMITVEQALLIAKNNWLPPSSHEATEGKYRPRSAATKLRCLRATYRQLLRWLRSFEEFGKNP
jgi:hypothetical protein